jgi:hypothetical protein
MNLSRSGGVLLASRREFIVDRLDLSLDGFDDLQFTDILGVKIVCHKFCLYMFLVYIHPKSILQEYDLLFQLLGQLNYIQGKNVMILGDFNIPAYTLDLTITSIHDGKTSVLFNFLQFYNLHQYNRVPNNFDRYFDLVLCNKECAVFKAVDVLLSEDLHHPSLLMNLSLNVSTVKSFSNKNFKRWNFRKADFHMLYKKIASTEWSFLEDCTNVDIACSLFYNKFNNLLDTCVPKTCSGYNGCYPPWFNSSIIINIKRKWQIWRQYKINNNPVTC